MAAAIVASSKVKTRSFTGSMKLTPGARRSALGKSGQGVTMNFSGAIDASDPGRPKMLVNMDAGGDATRMVVPGDGKLYLTSGGKSYYTVIPPDRATKSTADPAKIYAALGSAVGSFKESASLTNAFGQAVDTVSAKVSRSRLCGDVLEAFGDSLSRAGGVGRSLGAGAGGGSGGSAEMMKRICKSMLKGDPRVWFGIDAGRLTDVVLTAEMTIPFAGSMKLELIYHEFNQDGKQTGFQPPSGATPLESATQLPAA